MPPSSGFTTSQLSIYNLLDFDPDGAGVGLEDIDNDGFFDDLAPGESFTFSYEVNLEPSYGNNCTDPNTSRSFIGYEHMYTHAACKTQCIFNIPGRAVDTNHSPLTGN